MKNKKMLTLIGIAVSLILSIVSLITSICVCATVNSKTTDTETETVKDDNEIEPLPTFDFYVGDVVKILNDCAKEETFDFTVYGVYAQNYIPISSPKYENFNIHVMTQYQNINSVLVTLPKNASAEDKAFLSNFFYEILSLAAPDCGGNEIADISIDLVCNTAAYHRKYGFIAECLEYDADNIICQISKDETTE